MKDVIKNFYDNCPVGGTATAVPDRSLGESLEGFQSVLIAAEVMRDNGLIDIKQVHRESQTGKRLIDAIIFMRLK